MDQQKQTMVKSKRKVAMLCYECNQKRYRLDENHQVCHVCYKAKTIFKPSGNRVVDDFIKYTLINDTRLGVKMLFVPYDRFKNIEFIFEGGFSKIYKAIWIDGPINHWNNKKQCYSQTKQNYPVVLKKLNNSKDITSTKELNELKAFYVVSLKSITYSGNRDKQICKYFGITQDPITQDIMIIMAYYNSGNLINHFITNDFYSFSWKNKLDSLQRIIFGLKNMHDVNIVHRNLHSGHIFFRGTEAVIGDLNSAIDLTSDDNNNENYGVIPYMAPEIFQGEKYTKASDIYSFGIIMWEFMTGRRPFWDRIHNAELIVEICDGLRPPIVTNAPEGYVELMKKCWQPDPKRRPIALHIRNVIDKLGNNEQYNYKTKIIKSPDIGVTINNIDAIYKSRPLSDMIQSAMFTKFLRNQYINLLETDKRQLEDDQTENNFNGQKRMKLIENESNELGLDVEQDYEFTNQGFDFDFDIDTFYYLL